MQGGSALAGFLLARIAEAESAWSGGVGLVTRPDFAKLASSMLVECEAKRQIIEFVTEHHEWDEPYLLAMLALPYADHPNYRPEWRTEWRPRGT